MVHACMVMRVLMFGALFTDVVSSMPFAVYYVRFVGTVGCGCGGGACMPSMFAYDVSKGALLHLCLCMRVYIKWRGLNRWLLVSAVLCKRKWESNLSGGGNARRIVCFFVRKLIYSHAKPKTRNNLVQYD